jgi:hypothetical protein
LLFQRGSAESNDPDQRDPEDPLRDRRPNSPAPVHRGGLALKLYSHSLSIALFLLFAICFVLHGLGGLSKHNWEATRHHSAAMTLPEYLGSSSFWFESFQNWQSEFLSVGVLIVLSIFLRQRGSSQSKPVAAAHAQTGSE